MATTIVNPGPSNNESNSGMGFLLGAIALIVFAVIVVVYFLPYFRQGFGGIQVNVPKDVNVNVQQQSK